MSQDGKKSDNRACGAKTRKGLSCQNSPVLGRNRCRMHGGASLRGSNHPNFKHGRRSKALPRHLLRIYEEACSDANLLDLRSEIALGDARVIDLLERLGEEQGPDRASSVWTEIGHWMDRRARLVGVVVRHQVLSGQMISAEEVSVLTASLVHIIRKHVKDQAIRNAIGEEVGKLLPDS